MKKLPTSPRSSNYHEIEIQKRVNVEIGRAPENAHTATSAFSRMKEKKGLRKNILLLNTRRLIALCLVILITAERIAPMMAIGQSG